MKKRTYWCIYGCGKKIRLLTRGYIPIYTPVYICYGCKKLFEKISIGDKRPYKFKEMGDKNGE